MTEKQLKKVRQYYHSLVGLQSALEKTCKASGLVPEATVGLLEQEMSALYNDFPDLVPRVHLQQFHLREDREWYRLDGILSVIALAIGKLEVAIEGSESTPVTETRTFPFIQDASLRKVVERDYVETQKVFVAQCWKSVIILSGSAIEAILLDLLLANDAKARASAKAPKKPDIRAWDLADLIKVSVDLKLVTGAVEKLSDPVREYRNLVHPGNEIRTGLTFGGGEARIALEVLNILHRDLSK